MKSSRRVTFSRNQQAENHWCEAKSRKYIVGHLLGNLADSWLNKWGHKWKASSRIKQTQSIMSDYGSGSNERCLRGSWGGCFDGFWLRLQLSVLGQASPAKKAKAFFKCRTCTANLFQLGKGPQRWNKYACIMRMQRFLSARMYSSYTSKHSLDHNLEQMCFDTWHRFLPFHGETLKKPT